MVKYKILDNNKIVDEEYLRKLLFEYEVGDIWDNRDAYFEGEFNLLSQYDMLWIARFGSFDKVLYYLSTNWQVDVDEVDDEK